jgi:hypothetical protein
LIVFIATARAGQEQGWAARTGRVRHGGVARVARVAGLGNYVAGVNTQKGVGRLAQTLHKAWARPFSERFISRLGLACGWQPNQGAAAMAVFLADEPGSGIASTALGEQAGGQADRRAGESGRVGRRVE